MRVSSPLFLFGAAAFAIACSDGHTEPAPGYENFGPTTPTTPSSSTTPILVDVDTGKTMTAAPGEGVGIFVEYGAGGNWHVWWTCDTNKTNLSCNFNVQIAMKSGAMSSLVTNGAAQGDTLQQTDAQTLTATTLTLSNAVDLRFAGDAGGAIEITASVSGVQDSSSFFFFVQDGQVNGGYTGKLTDPLRFEGSAP